VSASDLLANRSSSIGAVFYAHQWLVISSHELQTTNSLGSVSNQDIASNSLDRATNSRHVLSNSWDAATNSRDVLSNSS
jgi:hypothetical protein